MLCKGKRRAICCCVRVGGKREAGFSRCFGKFACQMSKHLVCGDGDQKFADIAAFSDKFFGDGVYKARIVGGIFAGKGVAIPLTDKAALDVFAVGEFLGHLSSSVEGAVDVVGDMEVPRGIDGAVIFFVSPTSDGIEVFKAEADGIDQHVASRTSGISAMLFKALAGGEVGVEVGGFDDDIVGWRVRDLAEQMGADK